MPRHGTLTALRNFDRYGGHTTAIIVKRNDHPHVHGDYYYAIRRDDKHAWSPGESVLTPDEVTELWYFASCPRFKPEVIHR